MKNWAESKLKKAISVAGPLVYRDARLFENIINDLCPKKSARDRAALVAAVKSGAVLEMFNTVSRKADISPDILSARGVSRLLSNFPLEEAAARWAIKSWAPALCSVAHSRIPLDKWYSRFFRKVAMWLKPQCESRIKPKKEERRPHISTGVLGQVRMKYWKIVLNIELRKMAWMIENDRHVYYHKVNFPMG